MSFYFVIYISVGSSISGPPIIFTVPVGFRKIGTNHKILFSECIKHILGNIGSGIILKCTVHNREICLLCIKQIKSIMMFSRKNHIFHSCRFSNFGPLIRIKLCWVEFMNQIIIISFVIFICNCTISWNPVNIFRTDRP